MVLDEKEAIWLAKEREALDQEIADLRRRLERYDAILDADLMEKLLMLKNKRK